MSKSSEKSGNTCMKLFHTCVKFSDEIKFVVLYVEKKNCVSLSNAYSICKIYAYFGFISFRSFQTHTIGHANDSIVICWDLYSTS